MLCTCPIYFQLFHSESVKSLLAQLLLRSHGNKVKYFDFAVLSSFWFVFVSIFVLVFTFTVTDLI